MHRLKDILSTENQLCSSGIKKCLQKTNFCNMVVYQIWYLIIYPYKYGELRMLDETYIEMVLGNLGKHSKHIFWQ